MPIRVAVVGKGGAGKSTIAGTLARLLARRGDKVLALDSDPMPGLALSLGMGNVKAAMLNDAVEKDAEGRWQLRAGIGAARAVSRYAVDGPDGIRFLQYGKAGADGLSAIFPSVTGFGQIVHRLARDKVLTDWSVVGDLAAGTRQTAFDWAPYADRYLVVMEPTWASILTGRRLMRFARDRGAPRIDVIANKTEGDDDAGLIAERTGQPPLVILRRDPAVAAADRAGVAVVDLDPDSPTVAAVADLVEGLAPRPPD